MMFHTSLMDSCSTTTHPCEHNPLETLQSGSQCHSPLDNILNNWLPRLEDFVLGVALLTVGFTWFNEQFLPDFSFHLVKFLDYFRYFYYLDKWAGQNNNIVIH